MASPVEKVPARTSASHSRPTSRAAAPTRSSAPEKKPAAPTRGDKVSLSAEARGSEAAASGSIPNFSASYGSHPAVDSARKFLGQNAIDVKGKLPNFTAPGGETNNCANFVTANLVNSGDLSRTFDRVKDLEKALPGEGYKKVSAEDAKAGDIWIAKEGSHAELVSADGGTSTIGSNNDRKNHQVISERSKDPDAGWYWQKQPPQTLVAAR